VRGQGMPCPYCSFHNDAEKFFLSGTEQKALSAMQYQRLIHRVDHFAVYFNRIASN
jgi:hypothetical protein